MTPEYEEPADAPPGERVADGRPAEEVAADKPPRDRPPGEEDDLVTGEGVNEGAAEMVEESPEADEDA